MSYFSRKATWYIKEERINRGLAPRLAFWAKENDGQPDDLSYMEMWLEGSTLNRSSLAAPHPRLRTSAANCPIPLLQKFMGCDGHNVLGGNS